MGKLTSLAALSPFGPIFGKELRTTARRKRTYLLRVVYLGALFLFMLLVYTETAGRLDARSVGVAERAQREAELGAAFFGTFAMFNVIALALIAPVLTATAVGAERLARTLNVLLMTPITSWQIASGKLFSRMLTALTLIGLSLPVLAVVRLLGGVDLDRMIGVLAVCCATALACAALGLLFSTFINRAYAVILLSYGVMLIWYAFVPPVFAAIFLSNSGLGSRGGLFWMRLYAAQNPFMATAMEAFPRGMFGGFTVWPCVIVHLVFTAGLLWWCAAIIRRRARREGEGGGVPAVAPTAIPAAQVSAVAPLPPGPPGFPVTPRSVGAPVPALAVKESSVSDNPVAWREVRRPLFAKKWQRVVGAIVPALLLLISYLAIAAIEHRGLGEWQWQAVYAVIFCGLLCLVTCILSATAIASEKESDTWTLLLVTPLTAKAIVLGKVAGLMRRLMWPVVFIAAHFMLFTVTGVIPLSGWVLILWLILTTNLLWLVTGLHLSLRLKRVTTAVVLNLLLPLVLYLGVFVVLQIAGNLTDRRASWGEAVVGAYAPYPYLVNGLEGMHREESYRRVNSYQMPDNGSVDGPTFAMIVFVVGLGYLLLSALVVLMTIRRFDRMVGRTPQLKLPVAGGFPVVGVVGG